MSSMRFNYLIFFFNDTATTEIYTLSLHDALPIFGLINIQFAIKNETVYVIEANPRASRTVPFIAKAYQEPRSEEHTSELQSRQYLVCRLLLEKKNKLITRTR